MKTLSILVLSSLLLGTSVYAQVNNTSSTNTGNVSGNTGGAPATMDIDFGAVGTWLVTRVHTLDLDSQAANMINSGVTKKNYIAAFNAEGAMVYQYELNGEKMSEWDDIGRNAGFQLLPYSIQIMQGGMNKVSFSAGSFRNMNSHENSEHKYDADFFKVVDRLDMFSFTWDNHMTFNNIQTFDFSVVNLGMKVGLAKNEANTNYLALKMGGNAGGVITKIDNAGSLGYANNGQMGWKAEYTGGLELNLQAKNNIRVNLQSNFVGGVTGVQLHNNSVDAMNNNNTQIFQGQMNQFNSATDQYNVANSQYSTNMSLFEAAKTAYEATCPCNCQLTDAAYAQVSGNAVPTAPTAPTKPTQADSQDPNQTLVRTYGYIKNSVDVSIPLKKSGHPMRLGVGVDVNFVLFDKVINSNSQNYGSVARIDLSNNYNQAVRGRLYLNF